MKKGMVISALIIAMCIPQISYSQSDKISEEVIREGYESVVGVIRQSNYLSINKIQEKILPLEYELNDMAVKLEDICTDLRKSIKLLETSDLEIISSYVEIIQLRAAVCWYDSKLLAEGLNIKDKHMLEYYKNLNNIMIISKGRMLSGLEQMTYRYFFLKNKASLYLIDKAKEQIKRAVQLYDRINSIVIQTLSDMENIPDYDVWKKEMGF